MIKIAVMGAGWAISDVGSAFITRSGLSSSLVGSLITVVVTSLPEITTTLIAVRRGALQLAVGGIIGANTFDTLFLVASDASYRGARSIMRSRRMIFIGWNRIADDSRSTGGTDPAPGGRAGSGSKASQCC